MNDIIQYYFHTQLGVIELVASALTLICVFQLAQQSIWNFLWGILGVLLFGYIFYQSKLYADTTLQFGYYLPIQIYGWWYWYYKGDEVEPDTLKPSTLLGEECILVLLFIIIGTTGAGYAYHTWTNASYPWWDSYILVTSIAAQFLLSKKFIENWLLWITVDLVAIPIYFLKGLYVTSGLYVILLVLCLYGLVQWNKDLPKEEES